MEKISPAGVFNYLADRPEEARLFNAAMTAKAHGHVAGILGAYDFSGFRVIGDIGGGHGHLLRAVLERAPATRGVLFDLPNVLREVADLASERLALQPGDFFSDPLPACDAYLLMEVIHDWGDEEATAILKAVRAAAPAHAKLLVIEQIVPDEPGPHWAKTLDMLMLAVTGGLQRTGQEYGALLAALRLSARAADRHGRRDRNLRSCAEVSRGATVPPFFFWGGKKKNVPGGVAPLSAEKG